MNQPANGLRWCQVCDAEVVPPGERCECGALVEREQACTVCGKQTIVLPAELEYLTMRTVAHDFETYGPLLDPEVSETARTAVHALMILASEELIGHPAEVAA